MTFSMPQKQPPAMIATSRGPAGSIAGLAIGAGAELVGSQPVPSTASSASARSDPVMRFIMPQLRAPRAGVTARAARPPPGTPESGQRSGAGDHHDDGGLPV